MKAIPVNRNDEYTIGKIVFIAQEKDSRPITPRLHNIGGYFHYTKDNDRR